MSRKILLVDDEPNVLQGYKRQLRKEFDITTAVGGIEALEVIRESEPFAVIVSDMQMPGMDGLEFLKAARELTAHSVLMMLTGNADQKTATNAINEGHVFRFMTKPCSVETLSASLQTGLEQYRLISAEQELLSKTLSGSVSVLTEVLSMVNPTAFGNSANVRRIVKEICHSMKLSNAWEIELAAMLSQIGCVTIPEKTLAKIANGESITPEEKEMYDAHPQVGARLLAKIPRLQKVAQIVAYQHQPLNAPLPVIEDFPVSELPLGSRILKVVWDFVQLQNSIPPNEDSSDDNSPNEEVLRILLQKGDVYDQQVMKKLIEVAGIEGVALSVNIDQLEDDMTLDEHVTCLDGYILLCKGLQVTASIRERLKNFAKTAKGVREPIRVRRYFRKQPS